MKGSAIVVRRFLLLAIVLTGAGLTACREWKGIEAKAREISQCNYVLERAWKAALDYYENNRCSQSSSEGCNCATCARLSDDVNAQKQKQDWYDRQCQASFVKGCIRTYYCSYRSQDPNLDGNVRGCGLLRAVLPRGPSECSAWRSDPS
jgi:hypothetical protein